MASTNTELGHRGATSAHAYLRAGSFMPLAVPGACVIHSHEAYSTAAIKQRTRMSPMHTRTQAIARNFAAPPRWTQNSSSRHE